MSLVSSVRGEPQKVSVNGQPPQDVRLIFETYRIVNDTDTQELIEVFATGVEIVMQLEGHKCSYVIIKRAEPLKLALPE